MNGYRLSLDAAQDLDDIWEFIAGEYLDNIDTADRFIDRLEESLHRLVDNPFMGRERPDLAADVRSLVVDNYLIIYRPAALGIDVVRIVRGSRDLSRLFQP